MSHLLEISGLYKSFGGLMAINGIDLILEPSEILGLIGPNGSGKTTLFNLISGFFKADRGAIRFLGVDIVGSNSAAICQMGIARTFQITRPFPLLTVMENVKLGRAYGSSPAKRLDQAQREAEEIVDWIGLGSKRSVPAGRLSLIDRKRLELGKALSTKPKVLLLDEIMAGLNPTEIETALRLVRQVADSGVSIIVIEHMMRAIMGLSKRIIVLNAGRKIAEGVPQEVVSDRQVIEAFLGEDEDAED
jgi:branched-chain amino acid transport system ATP-binding protein